MKYHREKGKINSRETFENKLLLLSFFQKTMKIKKQFFEFIKNSIIYIP